MSVLNKLACAQNRNDEVPNQQLASELVEENNTKGIQEIVENLRNRDKRIQNDCIKVLYEIGYRKPELIADYVDDFFRLLKGKNNRLIWGGMIALSTIALIKPKEIFNNLEEIKAAVANGSVITVDYGIKTLAIVASVSNEYRTQIFPYLLNHLKNCRPKEVAAHAEFISKAVDSSNMHQFSAVLNERLDILKPSQVKRIQKLIKQLKA